MPTARKKRAAPAKDATGVTQLQETPYHSGPTIHRAYDATLEQDTRAATFGAHQLDGHPNLQSPAPTRLPANPPGVQQAKGARMHDPERAELIAMDGSGIQASQINAIGEMALDSEKRLSFCKRQRLTGHSSPRCPLSQPGMRSKKPPCDDVSCSCRVSYTTVALNLGLGAPSIVRAASLPTDPSPQPSGCGLTDAHLFSWVVVWHRLALHARSCA